MIQPKTQTEKYWVSDFSFNEADVEFIYQFFLEQEKPQPLGAVTRAVMAHRVAEERNAVKRRLSGRIIYQPKKSYDVGDELVFPALQFSQGTVVDKREGLNPDHGKFDIIIVDVDGKQREFAAGLAVEHPLNSNDGLFLEPTTEVDLDELFRQFGNQVGGKIAAGMSTQGEFIQLAGQWFVKGLLMDINIGHLHLTEAILEMSEGGPLPPAEIMVHLDLDSAYKPDVQAFSLNHALKSDDRFDEVGARGQVLWFLRRLEPEIVQEAPERLRYNAVPYDKALLNPQLLLLERELDDEWSDLTSINVTEPVTLTLSFPHRWAGTLPLSSRTRALFDLGKTPRQIVTFIDEFSGDKIKGWVVKEGRYIAGLGDWFDANDLPIGGYIRLKKGSEPGTIMLGFDQRRPQREWVRLATAVDDRIKFELSRRRVGCGYDDQLIVGTDYVAAMDALFRRAESRQRSVPSLLAELFPELAELNPQNTVHAKTLYSAINILRRLPPGPIFAELVRHPAFQSVGDNYWQFDKSRWQRE